MGHKSLIFAENVLYWAVSEPNPAMPPFVVPYGFRENIEQGRGSSARRLCHRKRVKRVLPRVPKVPPRPAVVQPKAAPGFLLRIAGRHPRPRLPNPTKTKEAQCQTRLQKLPRKRRVRSPLLRRSPPPRLLRRPSQRLWSSPWSPSPWSPTSPWRLHRVSKSRRRF